jgi:hypothetical protein
MDVGENGIFERSLLRWRQTQLDSVAVIKNVTRHIYQRKPDGTSTRLKTEAWTQLEDAAGQEVYRVDGDVASRLQIANYIAGLRRIQIQEDTLRVT